MPDLANKKTKTRAPNCIGFSDKYRIIFSIRMAQAIFVWNIPALKTESVVYLKFRSNMASHVFSGNSKRRGRPEFQQQVHFQAQGRGGGGRFGPREEGSVLKASVVRIIAASPRLISPHGHWRALC